MKKSSLIFVAFLIARSLSAQTADNVLVIVNENSDDSRGITRYYAEKRKLPDKNICRLRTTTAETISREVYENEILKPVARHLLKNHLQDQILYIVTTRGLPLIVQGDDSPVGDLASVDSELTLAYQYMVNGSYQFHGRFENSYYAVQFDRDNFRPFVRRDYGIYLVTRLTGSTVVDAVFLIDRALTAEPSGAFYFDLASAKQSDESEWLAETKSGLEKQGFQTTMENTGKVLENLTGVLGYANEGSKDLNLAERPPRIQWKPGAIATVFDRVTVNPEDASTGRTAAYYVESGVTGFAGYVGDPTPDGFIRPQILFNSYAAGYNLAESFYAATRYISWRQVVIGDPLAAPFLKTLAERRAAVAPLFLPGVDPETGLPEYFAQRRKAYLTEKYFTTADSIIPLLSAEDAMGRGDLSGALRYVETSLQQNPDIRESHYLKAEILEQKADFAGAFKSYTRALEPANNNRELYLKLAELALEKLKDPKKALTYTEWLYRQAGQDDRKIAQLHAEAEFQAENTGEARAVYSRIINETNPPPPDALAALGRIHYAEGNLDLSKSFLAKALENMPEGRATSGSEKDCYVLSLDRAAVRKLLEEITAKETSKEVSVAVDSNGNDPDVREACAVHKTPVTYPESARLSGLQGIVVVSLLIDEMGQLMKSEVKHGNKTLAEAVLKAVRTWRFEPQLVRGRAAPSRLTLSFSFKINKPE